MGDPYGVYDDLWLEEQSAREEMAIQDFWDYLYTILPPQCPKCGEFDSLYIEQDWIGNYYEIGIPLLFKSYNFEENELIFSPTTPCLYKTYWYVAKCNECDFKEILHKEV